VNAPGTIFQNTLDGGKPRAPVGQGCPRRRRIHGYVVTSEKRLGGPEQHKWARGPASSGLDDLTRLLPSQGVVEDRTAVANAGHRLSADTTCY